MGDVKVLLFDLDLASQERWSPTVRKLLLSSFNDSYQFKFDEHRPNELPQAGGELSEALRRLCPDILFAIFGEGAWPMAADIFRILRQHPSAPPVIAIINSFER